jgi:hypothetical protein
VGNQGEKAVEFELKNSYIFMLCMYFINLERNGLKAQMDEIIDSYLKTEVELLSIKGFGLFKVNIKKGDVVMFGNKRNKILSLILVIVLVIGSMPVTFAFEIFRPINTLDTHEEFSRGVENLDTNIFFDTIEYIGGIDEFLEGLLNPNKNYLFTELSRLYVSVNLNTPIN